MAAPAGSTATSLKFSVLLPTHNRADVIGFAIRSVLAQTERDFELLVVGDGCTDGTAGVVQGFNDPRIRWFDLPKAPHFGYANRNVALREASGELLAFVAHDDLILPDHLAVFAKLFTRNEIDWAYSRPVWVADDGTVVPFAVDLRQADQLEHFLTGFNTIPASCVVYRRTCLDRVGYWPEEVVSAGDWEYWKSMLRGGGGANLAYVAAATTLHFRADWRRPHRDWGPPPLPAWLQMASDRERWPRDLQVPVEPGESPQAAFWRLIEGDPVGWPARLRAAVAEAIDGLAWNAALNLPGLGRDIVSIVLAIDAAGSHRNAVAVAEKALRIAPTDPYLHHVLGMALLNESRNAEAADAFSRAAELDPTVADFPGMLSIARHRQGRIEEAIWAADEAIALNPSIAWIQTQLGYLLAEQGRLAEAERAFGEALRLDPGQADAAARVADLRHRRSAQIEATGDLASPAEPDL